MVELLYCTLGIMVILSISYSLLIFMPFLTGFDAIDDLHNAINKSEVAYAETNNLIANSSNNVTESFPYLLDYSALETNNNLIDDSSTGQGQHGNSSNYLGLVSWGTGNFNIKQTYDEKGIALLSIDGFTRDDQAAGFVSKNLDFKGRYVLFYTGSIAKSANNQLSFLFVLKDGRKEYHLIFVNGPLSIQGWKNTNYYEKIDARSPKLIDLQRLLAPYTDSYALEKMMVVIQKGTYVTANFRVNLVSDSGNDNGHVSIFNTGHILHDRYIFHDLAISRLVDIVYQSVPKNYDIVGNGWIIASTKESKNSDNNSDNTLMNVEIVAKQPPISLTHSISKLDISESLLNLGSKDWMFLVSISAPVLLIYPCRMVKSK